MAIQKDYAKLGKNIPFTKRNLCNLMVSYKEKYGLSGREVLSIAKNEYSLEEISLIIEAHTIPDGTGATSTMD